MFVDIEPLKARIAVLEKKQRQMSVEFNAAINYALDKAGPEGLTFLSLWREGAWDEIRENWPDFVTSLSTPSAASTPG